MRSIRIAKRVRASTRALLRAVRSRAGTRTLAVRYSPRGIGDERPNVRDSRFTFPVGDEPVVLPLRPMGNSYLIAALLVGAFVVMVLLIGR